MFVDPLHALDVCDGMIIQGAQKVHMYAACLLLVHRLA